MINLNIPTTTDVKNKINDVIDDNQDTLVLGGTIAASALGFVLGCIVYVKVLELGVSRGIRRGFGR